MAKRTRTTTSDAQLTDTTALAADGANPRKITDEAAAGLRASLKRFGDLSGIVYNRGTGELVTGHQRMDQIRAEFGERDVEVVDEAAGLYGIRVDGEHYFPVRVVDWSQAKQRAANVVANNAKIQGEFTAELSTYLLSVEAELSEQMPGVLDELLLVDLLAAGMSTADASNDPEQVEFEAQSVPDVYQVVVDCENEDAQKALYEKLLADGYEPKLLTV
jgi:hypothetical protein